MPKYTHRLLRHACYRQGIKRDKCFIYKNIESVPEFPNIVYVGVEDGRSFWIKEEYLELIKETK